ncbi:hypothetical protein JAAARDRAFT_192440 [Jaapia argillacea MUCL 33604]|uniref:Uncharacterized protein n=1 Tax=Jaapia argillacea MUCL 33604 TaxID=933084 RepID=A0A067PVT7_9AGAM|nr:hypothetical protein JAAARDRAFT_192440 [Jaapia argillacea MUCL 33604]
MAPPTKEEYFVSGSQFITVHARDNFSIIFHPVLIKGFVKFDGMLRSGKVTSDGLALLASYLNWAEIYNRLDFPSKFSTLDVATAKVHIHGPAPILSDIIDVSRVPALNR